RASSVLSRLQYGVLRHGWFAYGSCPTPQGAGPAERPAPAPAVGRVDQPTLRRTAGDAGVGGLPASGDAGARMSGLDAQARRHSVPKAGAVVKTDPFGRPLDSLPSDRRPTSEFGVKPGMLWPGLSSAARSNEQYGDEHGQRRQDKTHHSADDAGGGEPAPLNRRFGHVAHHRCGPGLSPAHPTQQHGGHTGERGEDREST